MNAAVEHYKAAVETGGLRAAGSQLADSLMHAGEHQQARDVLQGVLAAGSENWRDWFVDALLEELVGHLGLPQQQQRRDYPPEETILSVHTVAELEDFLRDGHALNQYVWLTLCLKHPVQRMTTLMAGAFLSQHPFVMAAAINVLIIELQDQNLLDESTDRLIDLLNDAPEARNEILSGAFPIDADIKEVVQELALRGFERPPKPPGVQLIDADNIPLPVEEHAI